MSKLMQLAQANYLDERASGPQDQYEAGRNCQDIRQDESGRWWVDIDSHNSFQVPDHRIMMVRCVRATVAKEDVDKLPDYVTREPDGFGCLLCKRVFPSLQGVKTHHGRAHAE